MRTFCILTLLAFLCFCQKVQALDKIDVVGQWHTTADGTIEDDLRFKENIIEVYYKDGSFYLEGTTIMYFNDSGDRQFTLAGPAKGKWRIEGGKIRKEYTEIKVDYFSSNLLGFDRKLVENIIKESLDEPETLVPVSVQENEIVAKESEDETVYKMSRIRVDKRKTASREAFIMPLASYSLDELWRDPTTKNLNEKDPVGERIRRTTIDLLAGEGFFPASILPTLGRRTGLAGTFRPTEEIQRRLLSMYAIVCWVTAAEENINSVDIRKFISKHGIDKNLTKSEKEILSMSRMKAQKQFQDTIGWKMENMWALSWVLGFEISPEVSHGQVGEEVLTPMLKFLSPSWKGKGMFGKKAELRNLIEVRQMEDLFYCAHNAVRSAQLGSPKTVPKGFHPIIHGGVVHERRHALTWVLSPGVAWDDTDLST